MICMRSLVLCCLAMIIGGLLMSCGEDGLSTDDSSTLQLSGGGETPVEGSGVFELPNDPIVNSYVMIHDTFSRDGVYPWYIEPVDGDADNPALYRDDDWWDWRNSYEVLVNFEVDGRTFIFGHDLDDRNSLLDIGETEEYHWFIQEILPDGKLGCETHTGHWDFSYEVVEVLYIDDEPYLFTHDLMDRKPLNTDDDFRWFIYPLLPGGKLGSQTDDGNWEWNYEAVTFFEKNGKPYLFIHDTDSRRIGEFPIYAWRYAYYVHDLLSGGKLDRDDHGRHTWKAGYEVLEGIEVDGDYFLFSHDLDKRDGEYKWYVEAFDENLELDDVGGNANHWHNSYEVVEPFKHGDKTYFIIHDTALRDDGRYRFIIEGIGADGRIKEDVYVSSWSHSYEAITAFSGMLPFEPDPENWMEQIADFIRHRNITDLIIPGTHDSGTSTMSAASNDPLGLVGPQLACDQGGIDLRSKREEFGEFSFNQAWNVCLGEATEKNAKTQEKNIIDSLYEGIRYIDVRLEFENGATMLEGLAPLLLVHALHGEVLETSLRQIRTFAQAHPKEIILLDFNHVKYKHLWPDSLGVSACEEKPQEWEHLYALNLIDEILGDFLVPMPQQCLGVNYTVGDLWNLGKNIIVIYDDPTANYFPKIWGTVDCPDDGLDKLWPIDGNYYYPDMDVDTDMGALKNKLEDFLDEGTEPGTFHVLQGVLKGRDPDNLWNQVNYCNKLGDYYVNNDHRKLHSYMPACFTTWLWNEWVKHPNLNIVMTDFFNRTSLVNEAIFINSMCNEEGISGEISLSADTLWSPNHEMQTVDIDVSDLNLSNPGSTHIQLVSVTVEEPSRASGENIYGPNNFEPDYEIIDDLEVMLRSERDGRASQRIYTLHIEATDCSGQYLYDLEVMVPHDQKVWQYRAGPEYHWRWINVKAEN